VFVNAERNIRKNGLIIYVVHQKMNILKKFIYGSTVNMDNPPLDWWNAKRKEYNIRFIICLFIGQIITLSKSLYIQLYGINISNLKVELGLLIGATLPYVIGILIFDFILLVNINILYFTWPILEKIFFPNHFEGYRKICFAFFNLINIAIIIGYLCTTIFCSGTGLTASFFKG
jgi:hypothetical protein